MGRSTSSAETGGPDARPVRAGMADPFTVYRDPETSEVREGDTLPSLGEALCRLPSAGARIARRGETMARGVASNPDVDPREAEWRLTAAGLTEARRP